MFSDFLQDINEVQLLLPSETNILDYRFEKIFNKTINKQIQTIITTKIVKICFSGMESNMWRFQILCTSLEIEAKHMGSTTIMRKQINIFDEIIVHVNKLGVIIDLLNLSDIKERWEETKIELLDKNQGSKINDFVQDTDIFLQDKEQVIKFINSKEMYGLYFNNLWGEHDIKKPRFDGLKINIEKRKKYDYHSRHLQVPYNHDATINFNTEKKQKKHEGIFIYKKHQLLEAYFEVNEPNINTKYSLVSLTL